MGKPSKRLTLLRREAGEILRRIFLFLGEKRLPQHSEREYNSRGHINSPHQIHIYEAT